MIVSAYSTVPTPYRASSGAGAQTPRTIETGKGISLDL
jgi:hypothetical protein